MPSLSSAWHVRQAHCRTPSTQLPSQPASLEPQPWKYLLPSWTALPGALAAAAAVPTRIAGAPTMGVVPSWTAHPGALATAAAVPTRIAGAPTMGVLPSWTALPGALASRL